MKADSLSIEWYLGTMGFSYADWSGVFYPPDTAARDYLAYYSRIFNAVEIDSTFYGTPRPNTVQRWAAMTPAGFRFSLKVPRQITHEAVLVDVEAEFKQFVVTVQELGEKLGAILFQFPPSFTVEQLPALEAFMEGLPAGVRFAVEVRHPSWYITKEQGREPELAERLRQYGVAWAATHYPDLPHLIYPTAPFLYIRWIGRHGSFERHTEERIDRQEDLHDWLALIEAQVENIETMFGFFNNDYSGFAAGTANRFKGLAGLPVQSFEPPQPRLF
jgi:uncharacterized protein YecE (DUF72 family)